MKPQEGHLLRKGRKPRLEFWVLVHELCRADQGQYWKFDVSSVRQNMAAGANRELEVIKVSEPRVDALLFPELRHRKERVAKIRHVPHVGENQSDDLSTSCFSKHRHVANAFAIGQTPVGLRIDLVALAQIDKAGNIVGAAAGTT